jgi:fumarylacetoacetate (FAA) hydrolase
MRLATLKNDSLDGRLILVSRDSRHGVQAEAAPTLLHALQHWDAVAPALAAQRQRLDAGLAAGAFAFDPPPAPRRCRAARSGWTARPSSTTAG